MGVFDNGFQVVGFIGGCMFPLATGAQTLKALLSRSTTDISYGWQLVYAVAESLYIVYSLHFRLWVIFIPCVAELTLLVVMVLAKIYFDNFYTGRRRRRGLDQRNVNAPKVNGSVSGAGGVSLVGTEPSVEVMVPKEEEDRC